MSESAIPITTGSGAASVASDLVSNNNYQQIKVVDATLGSTNAWKVNTDGSAQVSILGTVLITGSVQGSFSPAANQSVSGTVGVSVIGVVPVALTTSSSLVSGVTSIITTTASVLVLTAPTGVQRNYVTQLLVTNGAAVSTFVDVVDNGAIIYTGYAAASGGGFSASFSAPLKQPSVASALYTAIRTQASVIVSASGYTAP